MKTSGKPPASGQGSAVGHGQRMRLVDEGQGGLRPAADHGHDPVAGGEERDLPADGHHLAGELHARDVGGPAGRRWIEAGPLHQVRRVDPGRPHRHQQLGVAGHRVVPLLPVQLAVPDHDGVHAGHPTRARARDHRCPVGSGHGSLRHPHPHPPGRRRQAGRLRRQDAAARQRGLQVRPHPAVRGPRAPAEDLRRPGLLGHRLPVQPVHGPGARHRRRRSRSSARPPTA